MALFDNLKTVLTPYAEKINDHTVDIHDLNTAVDSLNGSLESANAEIYSLNGSLGNISTDYTLYKNGSFAVANNDTTTISYNSETDTLSVNGANATYNGFYISLAYVPVNCKCSVDFDYEITSGTPTFIFGTKEITNGTTQKKFAKPSNGHGHAEWIQSSKDKYLMLYISGSTKQTSGISITNFSIEVSSGGALDTGARRQFDIIDRTEPIEVVWNAGYIDLSGDTVDMTDVISDGKFFHAIIPCENIKAYTLTLNGGSSKARAWAFADSNGSILSRSPRSAVLEHRVIFVPEGAVNLIVHTDSPWNTNAVRKNASVVRSVMSESGYEIDLTPSVSFTDGKACYYGFEGQQAVNAPNGSITSFVDVSEFDAIRFTRRRIVSTSQYYGCAFYIDPVNELEGNRVTGYREPYGYENYGYETVELSVPENANYFRTTWYVSTHDIYQNVPFSLVGIKKNDTKEKVSKLYPEPSDQFKDEMEDTIQKVRNDITEPSLVFMWVTDIHRHSSNAHGVQNFADTINNMHYFSNNVPCDFVLNTGDMTDGNVAKNTTFSRAYSCASAFKRIGIPYIWAQGNHDTNGYNDVFTIEECFKAYFTATNKDVIFNKSENGTDYYIDYIGLGLRIIVLNANNVNKSNRLYYTYGATTGAWLTTALNTEMDVIIAVHQSPISTQIADGQGTYGSASIISAINNFVANGGHLVMINGHTHTDMAFSSPWLSIVQDCQRYCEVTDDVVTTESSSITGFIDVIRKNARAENDARKDLWSVGIYKPISKDFDFIRFGAGKDRYFHTAPISPQTLVSRFDSPTWATSDENIATVVDGVVTGVATGKCTIVARDAEENYECWIVNVE